MPGPSLQDSGPSSDPLSEREASLDRQLKAWFDAMLQAPVPNDLLRHIDGLQAGDEKAR